MKKKQWTEDITIAKLVSGHILADQTEFVQMMMEHNFQGIRESRIRYGRTLSCPICHKHQVANSIYEFEFCNREGCRTGKMWINRKIRRWYLVTPMLYEQLDAYKEPTISCRGVHWWGSEAEEDMLIFHPVLQTISEAKK